MVIFLIVSFIVGLLFLIKYERSFENFFLFMSTFMMIILLILFVDSINKAKKVPKRYFTVIDKAKYNQCNKEASCQEVYNLYLKTDNGFSFKEPFDYNSYENARIGSKITYRQTYNRYLETGGKPFSNEE